MPFIQISDNNPTGRGESHFRNVTVVDRPTDGEKPLVNLGGGPRPTPETVAGVPCYLHDYFGPGRHAKVVSVKAASLLADGHEYRAFPPLTGDESLVAEVSGVDFPELLDPVDDLPPSTVITHVEPRGADRLLVRGIVSDNGQVARVLIVGQEAQLDAATGDWQIELSRDAASDGLSAHSIDEAGNEETLPHRIDR
jgi:hypothetical protein